MEKKALPRTSSSLDLTISFPGSSSGEGGGSRDMAGIRDLDINQVPEEEELMTLIALNSTNYSSNMAMEEDRDRDGDEDGGSASPPRKKLRLSKHQSQFLEHTFRLNHSLDTKQKQVVAVKLDLTPRQVQVWFQNRRARSKLKQMETECEYLRRWYTSLTDQNCTLQKELAELRESMAAAASICPRCHRITTVQPLDGPQS